MFILVVFLGSQVPFKVRDYKWYISFVGVKVSKLFLEKTELNWILRRCTLILLSTFLTFILSICVIVSPTWPKQFTKLLLFCFKLVVYSVVCFMSLVWVIMCIMYSASLPFWLRLGNNSFAYYKVITNIKYKVKAYFTSLIRCGLGFLNPINLTSC